MKGTLFLSDFSFLPAYLIAYQPLVLHMISTSVMCSMSNKGYLTLYRWRSSVTTENVFRLLIA